MSAQDSLLKLKEGSDSATPVMMDELAPWNVLVVDDDDQVHLVTDFVLRTTTILGRKVALTGAFSGAEARLRLCEKSYACVLLDVVMETDDAGLQVVRYIREELGDAAVRIVLRTGQPGHAPEMAVVSRYDINDYKSKSELTSEHLVTTLTASFRAYEQIRAAIEHRNGLELIFKAATSLNSVTSPSEFAARALSEVCNVLRVPPAGLVCLCGRDGTISDPYLLTVDAAAAVKRQSLDVCDTDVVADIREVLGNGASVFESDRIALLIETPRGSRIVLRVPCARPLSDLDRRLLQIFSINIAAGFDNAYLFDELERLAYFDDLTGLPNRLAFEAEVARQIGLYERGAVAIADIDSFQAVNDGLGHDIGDLTLIACAGLLHDVFGRDVFMARTSGDNFALLLPDCSEERVRERLHFLHVKTRENLQIEGNEIPLSISVGVAFFPDHGEGAGKLIQNAGIALKQAKRVNRSSFEFFDNGLESSLRSRLVVMRDLRYAVERGGLRLLYQPQINLASGQIFGVEALVRWQRDDTHLVSAQEFIPAAEDSGHIVAIGEWVLREACRQHLEWKRAAGIDLQMGVNVSMRQLKDAGFIDMLESAIGETGIDPSRLELELTESMMVENASVLIEVLRKVRSLGVRVAIDDFGTGYSSLGSLQKLPIDRLKIDRSFITGLATHREDQVIAALVINMGHLLGMQVIAEGVEDLEQASLLVKMGCDDVQGYFYGRPMPAASLLELAQDGNWKL